MPLEGKPQLFIITGSNGAGKSTLKQALLPPEFSALDIFDGDIFYAQKSSEFYKIHKSTKEARKLAEEALEQHFIELTEYHIHEQLHFAYEGHFTGSGAWKIPQKFKDAGFGINLIFCGLDKLTKSIQRVDIRVKKNGFHVPPLAIENNFWGNLEMVNKNYSLLDTIDVLDTSNAKILPVCTITREDVFSPLSDTQIPQWFKDGLPVLYRKIKRTNTDI